MLIGTLNHVKVKRLKRLLGVPLFSAMGVLESIWQLCMECCDEGNIGKFTDEEIAEHIEWHGSAQKLIDALTESGWFDKCDTERLVVHDWWAHCPDFIRNRVQKRKARRIKKDCAQDGERDIRTYVLENRDMSKKMETCLENPGHGVPISYPLQQQQPQAVIGETSSDCAKEETKLSKPIYAASFETWWAIYPKHKAKGDAAKAFDSAIRKIMAHRSLSRPEALEWLNLVTQSYAKTPEGDGGQYTPYGASWLNAARYDDNTAEWSKPSASAGVTYDPTAGANDPTFGVF